MLYPVLFDFGFVVKLTVKSNSQMEDTDPKVLAVQVSQYSMQSKSPDLCCMKLSRQDIKAQLVKTTDTICFPFLRFPNSNSFVFSIVGSGSTLHLWQAVHIYFDTSIFGRVSFSISVGWHGLKNMSLPSPLHRKVSFSLYRRVYSSVGEFLPQRVSFPSVGEFLPLWVGADWRPSLIFPSRDRVSHCFPQLARPAVPNQH